MVRLTDLIRGAEDFPEDQGGKSKATDPPAPPAAPSTRIQVKSIADARQPSVPQGDWYATAQTALESITGAIHDQREFSVAEIPLIATAFVASLARDDRLVIRSISDQKGSPLIGNMIHTAIFAIKIGMGMGYRPDELSRLGFAALVHDVGMFRLPDEMLNNEGRWTEDKLPLLHRHPLIGAEILKQAAPDQPWLPEVVAQEHERANGTGYPRGLKGDHIHEFAQIIGIADKFDALMTARPYRPRLLPHDAMRELLVAEKASFPSQTIKALVQQFSVFPLGTTVRLNTGEVGVVTKLNPHFPLRPVVEITQPSERTMPTDTKLLDLGKTTLVHIVEVVDPEMNPDKGQKGQ